MEKQFCKALVIKWIKNEVILTELEDFLLEKNIESYISWEDLIIVNTNYINNDNINISNYINEGRIIKEFLIDSKICDINNYKTFFLYIKNRIKWSRKYRKFY